MHIDFLADYILEDERVRLEPLRQQHLAGMLSFALNEPDLWQYSPRSAAGSTAMEQYLSDALLARASQTQYAFAVTDKRSGTLAGSTRFYDIHPEHHTLLLGYTWYGKAYQGTGLNTHCKYLLLRFAFEELGALRVELMADVRNLRSIAAMKKTGFVQEGILRSHMCMPDGTRCDSAVLSMLKSEWQSGAGSRLEEQCYQH